MARHKLDGTARSGSHGRRAGRLRLLPGASLALLLCGCAAGGVREVTPTPQPPPQPFGGPTAALGTPEQHRLVEALKQLRWNDPRDRSEVLIKQLAAAGDSVIPLLMAEFQLSRDNWPFRGGVTSVLESLKSDAARDALLEIARSKPGDALYGQHTETAAWALLRIARTADESKILLTVDYPQVVATVLYSCPSWSTFETPVRERLRELLRSADRIVRMAAAGAMAHDRDERVAAASAPLLLGMVTGTLDRRGADDVLVTTSGQTQAERESEWYIGALAGLAGSPQLLERLRTDNAIQRRALILARFFAGEAALGPQVRRMLKDPDAGVLRGYAAYVVGVRGGKEDLALLQDVANSDPLERIPAFQPHPEHPRKAYPVRVAAEQAIGRIQERLRRR